MQPNVFPVHPHAASITAGPRPVPQIKIGEEYPDILGLNLWTCVAALSKDVWEVNHYTFLMLDQTRTRRAWCDSEGVFQSSIYQPLKLGA